jgi:hypothetical protein
VPLLIPFDPSGLDPKTVSAFDDLIAAIQTWAGKVDGINKTVTSGVYTPTLTAMSNVQTVTAYPCSYLRVGKIVHVSGFLKVNPTMGTTTTEVAISLPVASDFAFEHQLAGVGIGGVAALTPETADIRAWLVRDIAQLRFESANTGNHEMWFTFTYQILS